MFTVHEVKLTFPLNNNKVIYLSTKQIFKMVFFLRKHVSDETLSYFSTSKM